MTSEKAKEFSRFAVKDISLNEFCDPTVCSGLVISVHLRVCELKSGAGIGVISLKAAHKLGKDDVSSLGIR